MKSLTFAYLLRTCVLATLLTFPCFAAAETNLRAAEQIVRQARSWNAAGKYEEARDTLVRYLERDSRSVVARLEYARTLSYLRQFPEALAEYQYVLKLEPENLEAQVGVAKVASWRGQFENALNLYRQILAQTPGLHDALVGKAHTLVWLGRKDEAISVFLDALERNPSDRDVRRVLEEMDVDVDAALAAAQKKAALSVRPEPQLAVLPALLPDELWIVEPDPPTATHPHAAPEKHLKAPVPVRRKIMRAPPPAAPAEAAPVEAALPTPLLLQAATVLIFLAGGA
ncbi:MAG: tetratricopeptide repeat protein, partial [Terriglobales bacterium]